MTFMMLVTHSYLWASHEKEDQGARPRVCKGNKWFDISRRSGRTPLASEGKSESLVILQMFLTSDNFQL
jgi:hypothetical protein